MNAALYEKLPYYGGDKDAVEWKLRCDQRNSTFQRFAAQGKVMALMCGSILVGMEPNGEVHQLENHTNWKMVFRSSRMYRSQPDWVNFKVAKLNKPQYSRLEQAVNTLGNAVCLSVRDLNDPVLVSNMWHIKKWCYRHGSTEAGTDQVIQYIKWVFKVAQAIILNGQFPDWEPYFPKIQYDKGKALTPFRGTALDFIDKIYSYCCSFSEDGNHVIQDLKPEEYLDRTKSYMTLAKAEMLSQIASMTRALPYPSTHMVRKQTKATLELLRTEPEPDDHALEVYKKSRIHYLRRILAHRKDEVDTTETHISLSKSSCFERTRSLGGKAQELVEATKLITDQVVTIKGLNEIRDCFDVYGNSILSDDVANHAISRIMCGETVLLRHVLYLTIDEHHEEFNNPLEVPKKLGFLILLACARTLLKYGTYSEDIYPNDFGIVVFHPTTVTTSCEQCGKKKKLVGKKRHKPCTHLKFIPSIDSIPVRASVSIEAGLKSRMVTAAPAAITEIGQLCNNFMRSFLGSDPSVRIGFDEGDKLWEVLDTYRKHYKERVSNSSNSSFFSGFLS